MQQPWFPWEPKSSFAITNVLTTVEKNNNKKPSLTLDYAGSNHEQSALDVSALSPSSSDIWFIHILLQIS